MATWSEGYVSDIAYSIGYYREMAPDHLVLAALAVSKDPGPAVQPKRVLELGFGMGLGFVVGAASQPDTFFEGCDFNPQHVAHTRRMAEAAGLSNVLIREASFQEIAGEAREGQHDLDIIQLHGILTWVSAEAHRAIVEIARKRLKPGGLLYVSYNCMPGWAAMLPVQRLMREHAKNGSGSSLQKTAAAMEAVRSLVKGEARFFGAYPQVAARLEKLGGMQMSYLAHEYLNENWFIFHFADVAAMMSEAKLTYLASASIAENIDLVSVPAEMRGLVAAATDPIWKETLRDFACNKQFRRDIYARGGNDLSNLESVQALNTMHFTLSMPRNQVTLKLPGPLGEMDANPEIYGSIADLLGDRIVPFDEIANLPALKQIGLAGVLQALSLMVHAGQVLPMVGGSNSNVAPGQSLNRALVAFATQGRSYNFLAAPAARAGISVTTIELLILSAVFAGLENDISGTVEYLMVIMHRLGIQPIKEGAAVTDPAAQREMLTEEALAIISRKLPLWRRLGVL